MHFTRSVVKALVLSLSTLPVNAFWRMPCLARSGLARLDPLIDPGVAGAHVHAIHGSSGFGMSSGYDELMAGDCTSCEVSEDKSAYWTPGVYFQDSATGKYELVDQVGGMLAYYLLYPNANNDSLSAFPKGFQVVAGDTDQRSFDYPIPDLPKSNWVGNMTEQAFLQQAALGFNCLNYDIAPEGTLYRHFLPDKAYLDANCKDGVRFELMFPSCWNGVDVDSPNHKDHVAYPSEVMTGNCPEGFETRLPSMLFETIWNTYAFAGQDGRFMISNGDPTGFGYHGDFIMGWNETFLQAAVDTCTNLSGQIEDCPLFTIQDASVYDSCNITIPSIIENDNPEGPVSPLPGNPAIVGLNGVTEGNSSPSSATSASAVLPTLSHSDGVTLAPTASVVPGAVFAAKVSASPDTPAASSSASASTYEIPAPASSSPSSSITVAPSLPATPSTSYMKTQYFTSGQVINEVLWVEEVVTITASASETTTMTRSARKRHLHGHVH